jgi:phosphoribosylformimino-5-aminoimidazole carboxamide ribotide isomerase
MELYPAIDIRRGKCVRLEQGDFAKATVYSDDPLDVAKRFEAAGARWIHVVDLDAARKRHSNRELVIEIAKSVKARVQTGGGIKDPDLLDHGIARVVFGSYALSSPVMVRAYIEMAPGKIAVAADHWDGDVRDHAWTKPTGLALRDLIRTFNTDELGAFVVTDISRDGMLEGPDTARYRELVELSVAPVIASGGVGTLDHLRALRDTGVEGAIVGKALYEGRFTLEEALGACAP